MKVHFHQLQLSLHLFSIPSPLALQMGAQPPSCATALPPLHPAFQILPHLHSSCSPGARVSLQLYPQRSHLILNSSLREEVLSTAD